VGTRQRISQFAVIIAGALAPLSAYAQDLQHSSTMRLRQPHYTFRPVGVVVFVHGLWGDPNGEPESTWRPNPAARSWPETLLEDPAFAGWQTAVFDYPSEKLSGFSIDEAASWLQDAINEPEIKAAPQIIFVGHSLGGLVVRRLLIDGSKELRERVRLLAFFGTPTEGSVFATAPILLTRNPGYSELAPITSPNRTLQKLKQQWGDQGLGALPAFCGYETQDYHGTLATRLVGKRIVEEASAVSLCRGGATSPVNGDHQDIVKPINDGKPNAHTLLRGWLRSTSDVSGISKSLVTQYLFGQSPLDNSSQTQLSAPLIPIAPGKGSGVGRKAVGEFAVLDSWRDRCLWSETLPQLTGSFSLTAWVWPNGLARTDTDPDRSEYIIGVQGSGSSGSYTLRRYDPRLGRDYVFLHVKTDLPGVPGSTEEFPSPSLPITAGWNFVVASFDISTKRACVSVNGSDFQCAVDPKAGNLHQPGGRAKFTLGCISNDVAPGQVPQVRQSFQGTISRVQVFDSVLTRRQVAELLVQGTNVLASEPNRR
jgi:pimeloyl-ACP methyl ester carboxylesterase